MNYKYIGIFMGAAFVAFYMVIQPAATGSLVRDMLAGIGGAAGDLANYMRSLFR